MNEIIEKETTFIDKTGTINRVVIRIRENLFYMIDTFIGNEPTGYARFYPNFENKIYLDVIYCYDKFRGRGIATSIFNIADEILSKYEGCIISGKYMPTQMSTDREKNIESSYEELDAKARSFYQKCGYTILSIDEYLASPLDYPEISKMSFYMGEEHCTEIVYKIIGNKRNICR